MAEKSVISKWRNSVPLIIGIAGALAGCASGSPPVEDISAAELAVDRAIEVRAEEYAPLELRRATEKLEHAKQSSEDEEYEEARQLAEEARVEARLAEAKARSEKVRNESQKLQETVEDLRQEIDRQSNE